MKYIGIGILFSLLTFTSANAAGWGSINRYVKPSGNCAGQEISRAHIPQGNVLQAVKDLIQMAILQRREHGLLEQP